LKDYFGVVEDQVIMRELPLKNLCTVTSSFNIFIVPKRKKNTDNKQGPIKIRKDTKDGVEEMKKSKKSKFKDIVNEEKTKQLEKGGTFRGT
jgi:hypothetical protein